MTKTKAKEQTLYIDSSKISAAFHLTKALSKIHSQIGKRKIVILCIGTDRATGDSLGPLIGYKLSHLNQKKSAIIFGTLEEPVHAANLEKTVKYIYTLSSDPFVIAIDACLGRDEHINYITLSRGGLIPGAGVNKYLPAVGDIAITGIVNRNSRIGINSLQSTRLYNVMNMADIITRSLSISML